MHGSRNSAGNEGSMQHTYALDTNAIIYYCVDEPAAVSKLQPILLVNTVIVPSMVVVELWSGRRTQQKEITNIETFLETVLVMPLDMSIAKSAGILRRDRGLSIGDSIIAATALATGATLLTRNIRDFKKVPNLILKAV